MHILYFRGFLVTFAFILGTKQVSGGPRYHEHALTNECLQDPYYNHLISLTARSCAPMDDEWYYVQHLLHTHHPDCARSAATYLRDYFRLHHASSSCVCTCSDTSLIPLETSHTLSHCWDSDHMFKVIISNTFYQTTRDHSSHSGHRSCPRHVDVWEYLSGVSDNHCFMELSERFYDTFFSRRPKRRCTCKQADSGGSSGVTVPHINHHYTDMCLMYSEYKDLDAVIARDNCMSHYEVWNKLANLSYHSASCRVKIIDRLNSVYGHFSHTPSNCTCMTSFEHLHLYRIPDGYIGTCLQENNYHALLTRLIQTNNQICSSHHTVWKNLANIPHITNHNYAYCQRDAIAHLSVAVSHTKHKCMCYQGHTATHPLHTPSPTTTTSTVPTTTTTTPTTTTTTPTTTTTTPTTTTTTPTTTTTTPTTTTSLPTHWIQIPGLDVKLCSEMSLVTGLVNEDILSEGSLTCSDGHHGLSESVPMNLCNAPDSSTWVKGHQVMTHCESLPKYSAIAAFPGSHYTHDGLVGVFVGCNSNYLTLATEDCTHGLSLFKIPIDGRDSYLHQANNYYTITW